MRYLLDTDVCVDYLTGRYPGVGSRLRQLDPSSVCVSTVSVAELRYGAEKSSRPVENHRRVDLLLAEMPILELSLAAAASYGRTRRALELRGEVIGPNDLFLAAQALAHSLILVTGNVDEFRRVAGLTLETWREPG